MIAPTTLTTSPRLPAGGSSVALPAIDFGAVLQTAMPSVSAALPAGDTTLHEANVAGGVVTPLQVPQGQALDRSEVPVSGTLTLREQPVLAFASDPQGNAVELAQVASRSLESLEKAKVESEHLPISEKGAAATPSNQEPEVRLDEQPPDALEQPVASSAIAIPLVASSLVRPSLPLRVATAEPSLAASRSMKTQAAPFAELTHHDLEVDVSQTFAGDAPSTTPSSVLAFTNEAMRIGLEVNSTGVDTASPPIATTNLPSLDLLSGDVWIDQLATDIVTVRSSDDRLSFRLRPDHLGTLDVTIDTQPAGLAIGLRVDNDDAAAILTASTSRLVDDLRQQGVKIDQGSVDVRQDGQPGRSPQQQAQRPVALPEFLIEAAEPAVDDTAIPTHGVRLA